MALNQSIWRSKSSNEIRCLMASMVPPSRSSKVKSFVECAFKKYGISTSLIVRHVLFTNWFGIIVNLWVVYVEVHIETKWQNDSCINEMNLLDRTVNEPVLCGYRKWISPNLLQLPLQLCLGRSRLAWKLSWHDPMKWWRNHLPNCYGSVAIKRLSSALQWQAGHQW
jgi:hypothetical protein